MLTLLHTNDFHNRLRPDQAERLGGLRESLGGRGLLLDAGDAVGAGNITYRPGGEPILDLMNTARYDAMTVGNREFHFTQVGFRRTLSRARFPILCANIHPSRVPVEGDADEGFDADADLPTTASLVCETDFGRVAVFGLTVPMITRRMLARKVSAYVFDDPIEKARTFVPWLRERFSPDLVVALTHIGNSRDRLLAEAVPGIDVIVGGHSHTRLDAGERVGDTLIVQAHCYAHLYGRVEIERTGGALRATARLEAL